MPLTVWIMINCRKLLERWKYQTIIPVSWETCMWGKKQQLEPCMEKKDWLKIKKGVQQGCLLWAWLFNLYTEHIMRNARLDELQAGIKIGERNINNLRYTDDTTLMAESKEELKSLLMSVKEESERASLRLNIKKKTPQDHVCEIRRQLLFWLKSNDKPRQCVENQRHYSASKGPYSLPSDHVRLWELDHNEGRMPKNWCLQTVVLEKTSKSPLDSKEIKPVNLKGDQPWMFTGRTDAEAEAPAFSHQIGTDDSLEKSWCWERLRAEEKGIRRWDGWTTSARQWKWTWANSGRWWGKRMPGVLQYMGSQRIGHYKGTEQQQHPYLGNSSQTL